MKKIIILISIIKFSFMYTQENIDKQYEVVSRDEALNYDVRNMKEYKYSEYNGSTSLFIDENKLYIFPNIGDGSSIIMSKDNYDKMFLNNSYPVLPENDTPYFRCKNWMNKENFNRENMIAILWELNLSYNKDTFYDDAEKLSKTLSEDDKKKLMIPMLFFIGEDLRKLCPEADWIFNKEYYFQPFNVPILYYEEHFFTFFYLNGLLDQKLFEGKAITFKKIYKKVEDYYNKEKWFWEKH